jgi:hypothetical protein
MLARLERIAFVVAASALLLVRMAIAQDRHWNPTAYDSLAPAASSKTIEPGIRITLSNPASAVNHFKAFSFLMRDSRGGSYAE